MIDACLVDTNVLLRIPRRSDPNHAAVDNALSKLAIQGKILYYTHQNFCQQHGPLHTSAEATLLPLADRSGLPRRHGNLATNRGRPCDKCVFVVHAKQFAEIRNLHGTTSCFQLFDKIHAGPPQSAFPHYFLSLCLTVQYF